MNHVIASNLMTKKFKAHTGFVAVEFLTAFLFFILLGRRYEAIPVAIWAAAPFLLGFIGGFIVRESERALLVSFIGSLLVFITTMAGYIDSFILNPDPQSALLIIFIPFYGLVIYGTFFIIAFVIHKKYKRTKNIPTPPAR